jgi:autotransporter-associated beta strand protein
MKSPTRSLGFLRCVFTLATSATALSAAVQVFDSANPAMVWDETTLNWDGSTAPWTQGNDASFATGTGTVAVSGTIQAREWILSSSTASTIAGIGDSGYRFNGGTISFGNQPGVIDTLGTGSRNHQINSRLAGTAGLTLYATGGDTGQGRLVLGGDNSGLSGGITVAAGLVAFTQPSATGGNTITLEGGGIFGSVNHSGTGTAIVNGVDQALASPVILNESSGNRIRVWGGRNLFLQGEISGPGGFRKADTGNLILGTTPTFTGDLILLQGGVISPTLQSLGGGTLTFSGTAQPTLGYHGSGETVTRQIHVGTSQGGILLNHGPGTLQITTDITGSATPFGFNITGGGVSSMNGISSGALINFNKEGLGIWTVNGPLTLTGGGIRPRSGILAFSASSSTATDAPIAERGNANGILRIATGSSIKTATANTTGGILGGWATFDNTTWAKTNGTGNAIDGLASFTNDIWAANTNTNVTLAGADPAADATTHSLRFHEEGAKTLTLAGTNTIQSGGILLTSAVGANAITITGGNLRGANNSDLVIHQFNTGGELTIASIIPNYAPARNGTTTNGSNIITGLSSTADLVTGLTITGTGIPAGATITAINSSSQITISANATSSATNTFTIGAASLTKTGAGTLVISGASSYTGTTRIYEGTLRVTGNNGNKLYQVGSQGRLELDIDGGTSGYGRGILVNGAGVASPHGVYLAGGRNFNLQSTLRLAGAPTTIRQFGTGNAILHGWDSNGTHLAVEPNASGSVIDLNVNFQSGGFGYVMNISPGVDHAAGDLTIRGILSGSTIYRKIGFGSLRLDGSGQSNNTGTFEIRQGSVILAGGENRLGAGSSVRLGEGPDSGLLILQGVNQTLTGVTTAGTGTSNAVVGGSATLSTLTINNSGATTMSTTLGGSGTHHNNLALAKTGTGILTVTSTNAHTGGTILTQGSLELGSTGALGTTGTISMNGGSLRFTPANTTVPESRIRIEDGALAGFDTNSLSITISSTLQTAALASGGLHKIGDGTLTLAATQTYQGETRVSGGILRLDYGSANGSMLSDTGVLTLAGGNLQLHGGSHNEIVGSTVITGNSTITRSSGNATLSLGNLSRSGVVTLNIAEPGIATTTTPNDGSGKLPAWITVAGEPAANDGSGNIIAFAGFTDVFRLGGKIPNSPTANIRIVNGGSSGDITPLLSGFTNIASISQEATDGPATITLGANDTLRLAATGEIKVAADVSPLILQGGTLTAGGSDGADGDLDFLVDGSLAIRSAINNNDIGMISINKIGTGTLALEASNSFDGDVTLAAGTLAINHPEALGLGRLFVNGGTLDNTSGEDLTVNDNVEQFWNGDFTFAGSSNLTFASGTVTLDGNRTLNISAGTLSLAAPVSGAFAITKNGPGTLALAAGSWSGLTTVNNGTLDIANRGVDGNYVVQPQATLRLAYITGGGYASTNLKLHGAGTSATTGLYLRGDSSYNASGTIELLTAPTTIRHFGEGLAAIGTFDVNGNGMSVSAAASGSVIDENIQFVSRGFGMSVIITPGTETATGDLVMNGRLNAGNLGFYKRGNGSIRLNQAATAANVAVQIQGGSVIAGAAEVLGASANLPISAGASLRLNGFDQSARNLSGAGAVLNGTETTATLTIETTADQTFSGTLGGAGPLDGNFAFTKSGSAKLTLSGTANNYSGDTSVTAGTLSLAQPYLADTAAIRITTGATLELTHAATDTVDSLYLDGAQLAAGTYNAANASFLSGTGSLLVLNGSTPQNAYDTWAAGFNLVGGRTGDDDNDGFTNLQEFLFGSNPTTPTGSLVSSSRSPSSLTLRWLQRNSATTYQFQESTTLANPWNPSAITPSADPDQSGVPEGLTRQQAVVPLDASRRFYRVEGAEN